MRKLIAAISMLGCAAIAYPQDFTSAWPKQTTRTWAGPEYWANRLQDWRIAGGRLECVETRAAKPLRTLHLLTRTLAKQPGDLRMAVRTGLVSQGPVTTPSWTGFLIGAGAGEIDYRAAALVHHLPGKGGGIIAALDEKGQIVFRDNGAAERGAVYPEFSGVARQPGGFPRKPDEDIELRLDAAPAGAVYDLTLAAFDHATGSKLASATLKGVDGARLAGNLALVSHFGGDHPDAHYWYEDWRVSGSKVERHEDHRFGPVLAAQHTVSGGTLKLTAQFPPLAREENNTASLEIRYSDREDWQGIATNYIQAPAYTVTFNVPGWDSTRDTQYRIVYRLRERDNPRHEYYWNGVVRREPAGREFVLAAFTGNSNCGAGADANRGGNAAAVRWTGDNLWFPHADIVRSVKAHKPDLLFFSGDQVYNSNSPTLNELAPEDKATLDYLYKWYLWCWAYADLVRDTPVVTLPDDHDVFHGNVWGWSGRKAPGADQNNGGYIMSPRFVNMVQRTQTSHLPDPYDPKPVEQGIGVYYTALNWGWVSFAVIEDRKFKSPPTLIKGATVDDGHIMDENFDPKLADVPGAELLGERQLKFLRDWAADWRGHSMKAVLSQTIFANLQTRNGKVDRDTDSDGWPQSGRNRALDEIRRGFALMVQGDQHLGSIIHHGIEDWNDAGYSFCVPSIANFYLRSWEPPQPGGSHKPGMPPYTGEYLDGFGNHVTVWAVANPKMPAQLTAAERAWKPVELHRKSPGFGIVRFNKADRTITMECWPRHGGAQYNGWPRTIPMEENYGRKAAAYLPELRVSGMRDPVVQVIDEADGSTVYTLRIQGTSFRPKVFKQGTYTVKIGEQGTARMKTLPGLRPGQPAVNVSF